MPGCLVVMLRHLVIRPGVLGGQSRMPDGQVRAPGGHAGVFGGQARAPGGQDS